MTAPFDTYLSPFLGTLLLCYAVGHLLFAAIDQRDWNAPLALLRKLAVGAAVLISLYALGVTGGHSVSIVTLGVLAAGFFCSKPRAEHLRRNIVQVEWRELGVVLAVGLFFFIMQANRFERCGVHPDTSFYAGVTSCMQRTGVETMVMDWVNPDLQSCWPYHYGMMWFAGGVGRLWSVPILPSLLLVVFPLLQTIFYAGMAALARKYLLKNNLWAYGLAMIVPCLMVVEVLFTSSLGVYSISFHGAGSLLTFKYLPVYIAFAAVATSASRSLFWTAFPLCALVGLYTTIVSVLFPGLVLALIAAFFMRRERVEILSTVGLVVGTGVVTLAFYLLHSVPATYAEYGVSTYRIIVDRSLVEPATIGITLLKRVLNTMLNGALCVAMIWLLPRQERGQLWEKLRAMAPVTAGVLAAAAVISAVGWAVIDSIQLWSMVFMPIMTILWFFVLVWCLTRLKGWRRAVPLVLVIGHLIAADKVPVHSVPDNTFLRQVERLSRQGGNFGYVMPGRLLMGKNLFYRNANYVNALTDLRLVTDRYLPANLSVYDIPYQRDELIELAYVVKAVECSPFYLWVEKNGLSKELPQAQDRFIVENDIRYLVVPRGLNWLEGRPFEVLDVLHHTSQPYDLYVIAPEGENKK